MKLTLVLCGAYRGQTVTLQGHQFVDGEVHLEGPQSAVEGAAYYLANGYQAYQRDSQDYYEATARDLKNNPDMDGLSSDIAVTELEAVRLEAISLRAADAAKKARERANKFANMGHGLSDVYKEEERSVQSDVPKAPGQPAASDQADDGPGAAEAKEASGSKLHPKRDRQQESMIIKEVVASLDAKDPGDWFDGKPRPSVVSESCGFNVTSAMIAKASKRRRKD